MFEPPQDAMLDTFANRAHNDFLEIFLESGFVGVIFIAVFIVWLGRRSWIIWTQGLPGMNDLDRQFACAASVSIGIFWRILLLTIRCGRAQSWLSLLSAAQCFALQYTRLKLSNHLGSNERTANQVRVKVKPQRPLPRQLGAQIWNGLKLGENKTVVNRSYDNQKTTYTAGLHSW